VRWDGASPLSTRHVEALMKERGVDVDPSPINRGTLQESPRLDETFPRRQRPGWVSFLG
jgi:transposase-like protein